MRMARNRISYAERIKELPKAFSSWWCLSKALVSNMLFVYYAILNVNHLIF